MVSVANMEEAQQSLEHSEGGAPAPEGLAAEGLYPGRRESLKVPPRPGMHLGLDDRRGVLDSPVLLPLMTVRTQRRFASDAVHGTTAGVHTLHIALQEEPSPTTGISLPAFTAALGLEAGARAFAAARGGQASSRAKDVRSSLFSTS